jgi:hypothetical protein
MTVESENIDVVPAGMTGTLLGSLGNGRPKEDGDVNPTLVVRWDFVAWGERAVNTQDGKPEYGCDPVDTQFDTVPIDAVEYIGTETGMDAP